MIPLPPGCQVSYNIRIVVSQLSDDMVQWFQDIGGKTSIEPTRVSYGGGKSSYHMQDNTDRVLLHFQAQDAGMAMAFIIKFNESVVSHNFPEFSNERA